MALATVLSLLSSATAARSQWISYPPTGLATLTHYDLPTDYIASCGCVPGSTHYPTAALSQLAYGSNTSYGPACGKCFKLTLLNPVIADPPFKPNVTKSIVVKIIDLCPFSEDGWCGATAQKQNAGGAYLNFDLAFPSSAIPSNFFPSDIALYGYSDFGVWNIAYEEVSCMADWAGGHNRVALGSTPSLESGACCPANPTNDSNTCPSYSEGNATPPDTAGVNAAPSNIIPRYLYMVLGLVLVGTS
ncbi:hypothetical protein AX15_006511 [Amanita polypyramis BW_CC]|nr:hypothetical protein AX15_006511 [Amanita polypyramis BW_CC]